jgi:hypothetical protein
VRAREGAAGVPEELRLEQRVGQRGAVLRDEGPAGARPVEVDRAGDQLFPRAALALDEHRELGVDDPVELAEDAVHRIGGADDRGVVEAAALAPELGAHDGQLAVLVAHAAAELRVQALDLPARVEEALVPRAQLGQEPRVADRDRGLVREQVDEVQVLLRERAALEAVVDVEDAVDPVLDADRQAHHGAQAQVLDALHVAEALVRAGVDREERPAAAQDLPRDPEREARARQRDVGAVEAARDADRHARDAAELLGRPRRVVRAFRALGQRRGEQQEPALSADERDGRVDDQAQEPVDLGLARELAADPGEHDEVVAPLGGRVGHRPHPDRREIVREVDGLRVAGRGQAIFRRRIEQDPRAADLHPVTRLEEAPGHFAPVHRGAVRGGEVDDPRALGPGLDPAVVARDLRARQADVVVDRPADGYHGPGDLDLRAHPLLQHGHLHRFAPLAAGPPEPAPV